MKIKRTLVYVLLSMVLVAPVSAMIAIAVLAQPDSTYEEYLTEVSQPSYDVIKRERMEEIVAAEGRFDSQQITTFSVPVSEDAEIAVLVEEGDLLKTGDRLFAVGRHDYQTDMPGVVSAVRETGKEAEVDIKSTEADSLLVNLPAEYWPYAKNTSVQFSYGGKDYAGTFQKAGSIVQEDNTFQIQFAIPKGPFPMYGRIPLQLATGRREEQTLTVAEEAIHKDGESAYVEVLSGDEISRVAVQTGIRGAGRIAIRPSAEGESLAEGMRVLTGSKAGSEAGAESGAKSAAVPVE